jgi:GcrA cell cycle regulator
VSDDDGKWTHERIASLKLLHASGISASRIASQIDGGFTRSAVLGKLWRMGISNVAPVELYEDDQPQRKSRKQAERPAPSMPNIVFREPDTSRRSTVLTLGIGCKWPIGDPLEEDFRFCGHDRREERPYCEYHCRVAYQPQSQRKKS